MHDEGTAPVLRENGLPSDSGIRNVIVLNRIDDWNCFHESGSEVSVIEKRSRRVFETEKGPGRSGALGKAFDKRPPDRL
jgi:hypothetical protein